MFLPGTISQNTWFKYFTGWQISKAWTNKYQFIIKNTQHTEQSKQN